MRSGAVVYVPLDPRLRRQRAVRNGLRLLIAVAAVGLAWLLVG